MYVARCLLRMHNHSGRFVDHEQLGVLEQNVERNFLRFGFDFFGRRFRQMNAVALAQNRARPRRLFIQNNVAVVNQRLQT